MKYDEQEIRKTLEVIRPDFVEVRIIGTNFTASGYFTDADTLLNSLKRYSEKEGVNFYMVMNEINPACYSRQQKDCFIEKPKETTSDKDIVTRDWLLIDMDCDRPSGVSSTEEELNRAKTKAKDVYVYLQGAGFEKPVVAVSGNGVHLLYKIQLLNDESSTKLIKDCLVALDILFSDDTVKIDTAVYNSARITKLYGTMACKGRNTDDRPHRMSKLTSIPDEIKVTDVAVLEKLAGTIPKPPKQTYTQQQFDLDSFISKSGLRVSGDTTYGGTRKITLEECPFNPEHKNKDAAIFVMSNGAIGFKCFHASCSSKTWQDVRTKYEPKAYETIRRITPRINSEEPVPFDAVPDEPDFYTVETAKEIDRSSIVTIKTGFKGIDDLMMGLNKQEVSCVSGFSGSGKSSILSQMSLNVIAQNYKVAIFSGELTESKVVNWIQLQAAGRQHTISNYNKNFFSVPADKKKLINKWLANKLFIYNNRKGDDVGTILQKLEQCIAKNKVDFVILDNLMAMNLDGYIGDENKKQKTFVLTIMKLAKKWDVHIVFIAHPKKPDGFLRKKDVSGSGHLTDAPDNVFLIHRNDVDFKAASKEMFRWKADHYVYSYDNVIEISKNRDFGVHDEFTGLYYETESKRFLNERYEPLQYDWEEDLDYSLPFDL